MNVTLTVCVTLDIFINILYMLQASSKFRHFVQWLKCLGICKKCLNGWFKEHDNLDNGEKL